MGFLRQVFHGTCFAERHSMSNTDQLVWAASARSRAITHSTVGFVAVLLFALTSPPAQTQVILNEAPISATIEAYGNATAGVAREAASIRGQTPDAVTFDGAARVLARLATLNGPNIGLRVVAEASNHDARVSEVSILLFGSAGRLEIGKRMGLPDVLTGYAPNSFTFTGGEFGPASGPSLDPGGGLQHVFLSANLAQQLNALA